MHSYNAPIVAKMYRGCWCRLATAFAAHMNGMRIAFEPAHVILVLLRRVRRACANVQTHQRLRCQQMISWYLSHCLVTIWLMLALANVQARQS